MPPGPTARLRFRTWTAADRALACATWGDPEVMRYLARAPLDDAACAARLAAEIASEAAHALSYWPIFLREPEPDAADAAAHVGCAGLKPSPWLPGVVELGFHLRPAHWGRGLATEVAAALVDHAWALGQPALCAGHHPENEGSRRVLARLGFRYLHHVFYPPTGVEHPGYRLDRPALLPRPPA